MLLISDIVNNAVRGSNWPIQKGLQDEIPDILSGLCDLIAKKELV